MVYLQNKNTTQTVKWEGWQYQLDLLDILLEYPELVILKARQLGISWLLVGFSLWTALFRDNAKILFFSQGESEAWDLVEKAKFIHSHLPDYLKLKLKNDTRGWVNFFDNGSEIRALPSTPKAGRGTDTTIVIRDELAQHPNGRENFTAIAPTLDSGGQSIDLSTIDKLDPTNHFSERVRQAYSGATRIDYPSGLVLFKKGKYEPALVFLGWKLRPVRQEGLSLAEWFKLRIKTKYSSFQIEQEYPETIEDALKVSDARAFFDIQATEAMMMHVSEPIKTDKIDLLDGVIRIYKLPVVGEKYIIFTDPSDGVEDPFHTVVMHSRTYEGVCEATGMLTADKCASIHDELVRFYNNAYNTYEVTGFSGGKFSESIKNLGTPGQCPRRDIATGKIIENKVGWSTSPEAKRMMLSGLEEAIRSRNIISHDKETINQFKTFIIPSGEKTPQPMRGCHDDAIMAWAGAWQIRKYLPVAPSQVRSTPYREVWR